MLLQSGDDSFDNTSIVVLPAWPCDWDVQFKLWAPLNTSVEVEYRGGVVHWLKVEVSSWKGGVGAGESVVCCVTPAAAAGALVQREMGRLRSLAAPKCCAKTACAHEYASET